VGLAIDHVVILVQNLAAAATDYAALGFTVAPGGQHTDGATHNALVTFADGSYIELLAFLRPAQEHRWWRQVPDGEGLIDFALVPDDIAAVIEAARGRGLPIDGPHPGGRQRPDGQRVAWQTGLPPSPDLPFLCADVTARELRVPPGPARRHPNGATGIAEVTVAVRDLEASAARYTALLGGPPAARAERRASFSLGHARLTLASPGPEDADLLARLERRGEGPAALVCATAGAPGTLDPARTHRVPLRLEV
jgi:catechol 2,3-dioxygenase-like lactoylglutathione lyase family enzyme